MAARAARARRRRARPCSTPGLLTHVNTRDGPLAVDYDRIARRGGETDVSVTVQRDAVADDTVALRIEGSYLEDVAVRSITPEPDGVTGGDEFVEYAFAAVPGEDLSVAFALVPDALWSSGGEIRLDDGTRVELSQFFLL